MIRVAPGIADLATGAKWLNGIDLLATGNYRLWLLRSAVVNEKPPVELLAVGNRVDQETFRNRILTENSNAVLEKDGSIRSATGVIRFAESLEASGLPAALDWRNGIDRQQIAGFNEYFAVFVGDKKITSLYHNSTGDWASLKKHVEANLPAGTKGKITIRERDAVLAEWTYDPPEPPKPATESFRVQFNGNERAAFFDTLTGVSVPGLLGVAKDKLKAAGFQIGDGDHVVVFHADHGGKAADEYIGGKIKLVVRGHRAGQHKIVALPLGDPDTVKKLAEAIGAADGESFVYSPIDRVAWKSAVHHEQAEYSVDNGGLYPRQFKASPTDFDDIVREAKKQFPECRELAIMALSENAKSLVFVRGYWTKVRV